MYLNTNNEFTITSYNRYTSVDGDRIYSNANVTFADDSEYDALCALLDTEITDINIKVDGTSVYHLANTSAKITNINESLDGDVMRMYAQIGFNDNVDA